MLIRWSRVDLPGHLCEEIREDGDDLFGIFGWTKQALSHHIGEEDIRWFEVMQMSEKTSETDEISLAID